jgi:hypothetical protein
MKDQCGCCEGTEILVPASIANRPGLNTLRYRIGTHGSFLETMKARLSGSQYPILRSLTTREGHDASIALLDAWATVADVLTFYQERIANEGYLRTAIERRSILELARLVGYRLRPGVAASVFLAFTVEDGFDAEIPTGTKAQSLPGPGELPQPFETSEPLKARSVSNTLKPRMTKPQNITFENVLSLETIFFEGVTTNLKVNDKLLFVFGDEPTRQVIRSVQKVTPQSSENRTEVSLVPVPFLVIRVVDALRFGVSYVKESMESSIYREIDGYFEPKYKDLTIILTNFLLGNYPQLDSDFFSHERLYQWLRNGPRGISSPHHALSALFRDCLYYLFNPPGIPMVEPDPSAAAITEQEQEELKKRFCWEALLASFDEVAGFLADRSFGQVLSCLASTLFEQARPILPRERRVLRGLLQSPELDAKVKQIYQWLQQPQSDQNQEKARQKVLNLLSKLPWFLRNSDLRQNLLGLLSDLLALRQEPFEPLSSVTNTETIFVLLKQLHHIALNIKPNPRFGCRQEQEATSLRELILPLLERPSLQPANSARLVRAPQEAFRLKADAIPQALVSLRPALRDVLYRAWENASVSSDQPQLKAVYALRLTVPLFGNNAPVKMALAPTGNSNLPYVAKPDGDWSPSSSEEAGDENLQQIYLDNAYTAILPDSYVVIRRNNLDSSTHVMSSDIQVFRTGSVTTRPRKAYGLSTQTTQIALSRPWVETELKMTHIRNTVVYAQSEWLTLAEAPNTADIAGDEIELHALYNDLQSGRWLIVSGERTDVPGTTGVPGRELVMLSTVTQSESATSTRTKSTLKLANKLAYTYKRDTVSVYANVVKATHGETLSETFGSGDGSQAFQTYSLRQTPLTYVAASTPDGAASSLVLRVNDVQWHEAESLLELGPKDRGYAIRLDDDGKTSIVFGDGTHGARLPTGIENIKGKYRRGIGRPGNVRAEQVKLLATKPLHVKNVINPIAATGGADRESRDQARQNAPRAVIALDRLVSVQDYADFARKFAGIGKASASRLSDGYREVVHLTIAGADDIPIDRNSDLYLNLRRALRQFGEPYQPIRAELRALSLLVVSAQIRILADYAWEFVEPKIRAAMLESFNFERRELGQDVTYSEVVSIIQSVEGVAYVDLDILDMVDEERLKNFLAKNGEEISRDGQRIVVERLHLILKHRLSPDLAHVDPVTHRILPAQLAYLDPALPDTLILTELHS